MERLKIMYFLDCGQTLGGAAQTLLRQAILMKKYGHMVIVVFSQYETAAICKDYTAICEKMNIDTFCADYTVSTQPEDIDIIPLIDNYNPTKKEIEKRNPDLLHSVQLNPMVELIARELDIPHVMNIYPAIPAFFTIPYIDVFPKYHICDSRYYAAVWAKYIHTESVCIRTEVDRSDNVKRIFSVEKDIKCICVGSIYKEKNQLSVIKAFHMALCSGIKGTLELYGYSGNDNYLQECTDYILNNHLTDNIVFKGFCENMQEVYENSDVLICGSTRESYPNVISESLASGVIVVATPVAGIPEVVKNRYNGYISLGYSSKEIYEKLMELVEDIKSGFINQILEKAYETYAKEHSPESVTRQLDNYYHDLKNHYTNKLTPNIDEVKEKFETIIKTYYNNRNLFTDDSAVKKKLWYLYHIYNKINALIENGKKFIIWGTGNYGKVTYEIANVFFREMNLAGFVDSFKTGNYMSLPIHSPSEVINNDNVVILLGILNGQREVIEQIEKNNKKCNEDYFIFAPRYW